MRTIKSAGPSSWASRCVTRQVASVARANRIQNSGSSITVHARLIRWQPCSHKPGSDLVGADPDSPCNLRLSYGSAVPQPT